LLSGTFATGTNKREEKRANKRGERKNIKKKRRIKSTISEDTNGTDTQTRAQKVKAACKEHPYITSTVLVCIIFFIMIIFYMFIKMPGTPDAKFKSLHYKAPLYSDASRRFQDAGRAAVAGIPVKTVGSGADGGYRRYNRRFYY
jgi:hypothetical protein